MSYREQEKYMEFVKELIMKSFGISREELDRKLITEPKRAEKILRKLGNRLEGYLSKARVN